MRNPLLILLAVLALATTGYSQVITNLPTVGLSMEQIGLSTSPLMRGTESFANSTMIDVSFRESFFVRGEILIGATDQAMQGVSVGGGLYRSWDKARAWGVMMARRNYLDDRWEGVAGIGAAWQPITQETSPLNNFSLFAESRIVLSRTHQGTETLAGVRYSF